MAEVYRKFAGVPSGGSHGVYDDPLNYVLSHHEKVNRALLAETIGRASIASTQLARHRSSGASSISVDSGSVDHTIWLTDRGSKGSGMTSVYAIEFGRAGGRGGAMPLRTAFPEVFN